MTEYEKLVINGIEYLKRYCKKKYGFLYSEEITSEVQLIALENKSKWDGKCKIESWIIAIANNKYKHETYLFNRIKKVNTSEINKPIFQDHNFDTKLILSQFNILPKTEQKALRLKILGFKLDEISNILQLEKSTIKTKISKARKTLKSMI